MTSDSLTRFMHHMMKMRQLTKVELINTYWQHALKIGDTGRLAFIIRGNMSWESERPDGVMGGKGVWLKSNRYEPEGKHVAEEPVRTYLQWYMNIYEIWGTIAVTIDPNDALASKPLIKQALEKVTCINNTMSLLFGASLRWYPALYTRIRHVSIPPPPEREETESWDCLPLARSQEEQTSIVVSDEAITHRLLPLVGEIESLPVPIRTVIKRAIDWHGQANRHTSGLNRFVNYWQSIELLGNFFYDRLPAGVVQRKTTEEKRRDIVDLLKNGVKLDNCMDVVTRCNEIRDPSARARIVAFLKVIADHERIEAELFKPDDKTGKSLYKIRNDIVHGRISEHDFEDIEVLGNRLFDAQKISSEIIWLSIKNAEKIKNVG